MINEEYNKLKDAYQELKKNNCKDFKKENDN